MQFPFGPYAPDRGAATPGIVLKAENVLPIPDGYGPAPTMLEPGGGDALPGAPRGSITCVKRDGSTQVFWFTAGEVYSQDADYGFTEIDNGYACPAGDDWSACQFGDFLLYTNTVDGLWAYDMENAGSPTYIAAAGDPRYVFANANQVFALNCKDASGTRQQKLIRNSDFNKHTVWKPKQGSADTQIVQTGGELVAGVALKNGAAVVFQRDAMRLIQFGNAGGGALYSLPDIAEGRGPVGAKSVIGFDGTVYFLATNGFWQFSQGGLVPIGDGLIDRWFLSVVPGNALQDVQAAIDPFRKVVLWVYPAGGMILGYCWAPSVTNRWFTWTTTATYLTRLATAGYTWDSAGGIWATWDDMPQIAFDDRFWQGGQPFLAALGSDYKINTYSGANAAATIRTATSPSPVTGLISWATVVDDCPTSQLCLATTDALSTAMAFDPAKRASKVSSGRTPLRGRGKNIALEWTAPAGATWTYAKGVDNIVAAMGGPR